VQVLWPVPGCASSRESLHHPSHPPPLYGRCASSRAWAGTGPSRRRASTLATYLRCRGWASPRSIWATLGRDGARPAQRCPLSSPPSRTHGTSLLTSLLNPLLTYLLTSIPYALHLHLLPCLLTYLHPVRTAPTPPSLLAYLPPSRTHCTYTSLLACLLTSIPYALHLVWQLCARGVGHMGHGDGPCVRRCDWGGVPHQGRQCSALLPTRPLAHHPWALSRRAHTPSRSPAARPSPTRVHLWHVLGPRSLTIPGPSPP
jgi:hypothetical protein